MNGISIALRKSESCCNRRLLPGVEPNPGGNAVKADNIAQRLHELASELEAEVKNRKRQIFSFHHGKIRVYRQPEVSYTEPSFSSKSERIWKNSVAHRILTQLNKERLTIGQLAKILDVPEIVIKSVCRYLVKQGYILGSAKVGKKCHRGHMNFTFFRSKKPVEVLEPPDGFTPVSGLINHKKVS